MTTIGTNKQLNDGDHHAASVYKAIALRFYSRYLHARDTAQLSGADIEEHGPLPNQAEEARRYANAVDEAVLEQSDTAAATSALVEFAGVLAADHLLAEMISNDGPVGRERDALHQVIALANVQQWLTKHVNREGLAKEAAVPRRA